MVRRVSQTLNQFNNGSIVQRLVISITVLVICLFITVSIATASGPVSIKFIRVLHIIADAFTLNSSQNQTDSLIVLQLRIPRIIIAGLVGMALSVAGATMQSLFRNQSSSIKRAKILDTVVCNFSARPFRQAGGGQA